MYVLYVGGNSECEFSKREYNTLEQRDKSQTSEKGVFSGKWIVPLMTAKATLSPRS